MKVIRKIPIFVIITIVIIGIYHNLSVDENSITVKIGIIDLYIPDSILDNKNIRSINYCILIEGRLNKNE